VAKKAVVEQAAAAKASADRQAAKVKMKNFQILKNSYGVPMIRRLKNLSLFCRI